MEQCTYTVRELAMKLQVSEKTVYALLHDQEIRSIRVRGQIRVPSSALEDFLKGGSNDGQNESKLV